MMFLFINAMRDILLHIVANLVSIICVLSGSFLAYKEKEGWGWFLFVGACTAVTIKFKNHGK